MKITPYLFLLLALILFAQDSHAQDCDYNYNIGSLVFWEKDLQRTSEQKTTSRKSIEKLELCIAKTSDNLQLGWLHHRLAQMQFSLDKKDQNVIKNAKAAFAAMPKEICTEYIQLHMWSQDDDPFPMQSHFLDILEDEELKSIRSHCQDNFKQIYLDKLEKREAKQKAEMQKTTIIQEYVDALKVVGINDQLERGTSEVNWDIQNELDAKNRTKLDELYNKFGFPSVELVGSELSREAFMIIHHSTDCEWNKKWTPRFVEYNEVHAYGDIFSFFFYRNFNDKDGSCTEDKAVIESLLSPEYSDKIKDLMDFTHWERLYNKK